MPAESHAEPTLRELADRAHRPAHHATRWYDDVSLRHMMDARDAEYVAACSPATIIALLDERDALRVRAEAAECERDRLGPDGQPVMEPDLIKWAQALDATDRHLASDERGEVRVSTVFLGLDHQFGDGPPILWETMIFGGEHDQYQERYSSRDDALAGHARARAMASEEPTP